MILSDRDIREAIAAGQIGIQPFNEADIQPSSIDLRVDRFFRTFHNHRYRVIDVKEPMEELTELVEVKEDEPFILHPGEFVLGSTREYVKLPHDLVARLEGKSSLGRLGLLIHSSLPRDEPVLFLRNGCLTQVPIGDIVRKRLEGSVVSFDPETFEVGYHQVTGWHETTPDRIFEVTLASGRRIRLTGGHALFGLDSHGNIAKRRVHELMTGNKIAVAGAIPDPSDTRTELNLLELAPEASYSRLVCGGPTIEAALADSFEEIVALLRDYGIKHASFYRDRGQLPFPVVLQLGKLAEALRPSDWVAVRGGRHRLPVTLEIDSQLAWFLGLYVAEGSCRRNQLTVSNTDDAILDRAEAVLKRLGLPVYRTVWGITCCSALATELMQWLGMGGYAHQKRIPSPLLGWPQRLLWFFFEGFVDGDGSRDDSRTSLWTSSDDLVGDLLLLCARLGQRAGSCFRARSKRGLWQIYVPNREHRLMTTAPECSSLITDIRKEVGLTQMAAAGAAGFKHNTQLNNIERARKPLRFKTLRALRDAYSPFNPASLRKLDRLVEGDLRWDTVTAVRDTGEVECVFDLEVRPSGRRIENFVAGHGGVLVANTAGYVDPGFEGHLTLELSNVANLPITIYPNMKIGQISFFKLTSEAENPYGSDKLGSKYQGQRGPTPSRYNENFDR